MTTRIRVTIERQAKPTPVANPVGYLGACVVINTLLATKLAQFPIPSWTALDMACCGRAAQIAVKPADEDWELHERSKRNNVEREVSHARRLHLFKLNAPADESEDGPS